MLRFNVRSILAGAALLAASTANAETVLTFGEAGPNRGPRAIATQHFVKRANELTEGELKIDVLWGGALFNAKAARQSISDGVADMGTIIGVYTPREFPGYTVADLPLKNPDSWVSVSATNALMSENDAIKANLASQNLEFLGTYTSSRVQLICKDEPITKVEDIKGKKIRGVGAYGKVIADMGANAVSVSIYDAYQALDTGLIDCSMTYAYATKALKHYEVADHVTELYWGQTGALGIFMSKDLFDSLPTEQQAALKQAGAEMSQLYARILVSANSEAMAELEELGVSVVDMPEDERNQLIDAGGQYVGAWVQQAAATGLDGEAILSRYKELIAQFEAERDEKGYPWERSE